MRGILNVMSLDSRCAVALLDRPVLDTSERAACSEHFADHEVLMNRLYLRHISWVSQEFGIDLRTFLIDKKTFNMQSSCAQVVAAPAAADCSGMPTEIPSFDK